MRHFKCKNGIVRSRQLLLIGVLSLFCHPLQAQFIDSILARARTVFASQRLHVEYPERNYHPGDTLWFRAFLQTDGETVPSTTLKIELLDTTGTARSGALFPVFNNDATGQLVIPRKAASGTYFVRAFTNRNASKQNAHPFIQPLLVLDGNTTFELRPYQKEIKANWSTQQRAVLAGIQNEVLFSFTDQYYDPIIADVFLLSSNKDTVCSARSAATGTGKLLFVPSLNEQNEAIVCAEKDTLRYRLPLAKQGISMTATPVSGKYYINLEQTENNITVPALLAGEMNLSGVFEIALTGRKKQSVVLTTDSLPNGILHLIAMDKDHRSLAELFVFVHRGIAAQLVAAQKTDSLIIAFNGDIAEGSKAAFAVISDTATPQYANALITEDLLFSGYFDRPVPAVHRLFEYNDPMTVTVCNFLLGALPVVKPSWEEMLRSASQPESGHMPDHLHFSGKMINSKGLPVTGKKRELTLILQTADSATKYWSIPLDSGGRFHDQGLVFTDSAKVFYRLTGDLDNEHKAILETDHEVANEMQLRHNDLSFLKWHPGIAIRNASVAVPIQETPNKDTSSRHSKQLTEVTVTSVKTLRQKTKELDARYTKGLFTKETSYTLNLLDDPPLNLGMTVLDYLKLRYPNIFIDGLPKNVYLNEGLADVNDVSNIRLSQVALIKFYRNFVLASGRSAVVVYLKKAEDVPSIQHPGLGQSFFVLQGYSPAWSFKPVASIADTTQQVTLLWNPEVEAASPGSKKIRVPFYPSNRTKPMVISIAGIDGAGNPFFYRKKL